MWPTQSVLNHCPITFLIPVTMPSPKIEFPSKSSVEPVV